MNEQVEQAYWNGFATKCAEVGVDAEALVKEGARYDQIAKLIARMARSSNTLGRSLGPQVHRATSERASAMTDMLRRAKLKQSPSDLVGLGDPLLRGKNSDTVLAALASLYRTPFRKP